MEITSLSKRYSEYSRIIHSQSSAAKTSVRLELFFCYIGDHMGEFLNKLPETTSVLYRQNRTMNYVIFLNNIFRSWRNRHKAITGNLVPHLDCEIVASRPNWLNLDLQLTTMTINFSIVTEMWAISSFNLTYI